MAKLEDDNDKIVALAPPAIEETTSTNDGGSQWAQEDPAGDGEAGEGERREGEDSIGGRSAMMTTTKLLPLRSLLPP
jgi:hypothetical protein